MPKQPAKVIKKLQNAENVTIAALGDSLTSGWMVSKGYLDFLREMLAEAYPQSSIRIINAGVPGNTAHDGRYRLDFDVLTYSPDCVLVQFGLNDAFCGRSPMQFRADIATIVAEIRLAGSADIVLVTSNYLGENKQNDYMYIFYQQLGLLAQEQDLCIVPTHEYWCEKVLQGIPFASLVQQDGVHPTATGYALMAAAVMELFSA